jgi:hypothetical protein
MNGFLLYAEYKEHFQNFDTDAERIELLYAIFDYHSKRETKIVSKAVKIAFGFVKKELDRQILKYDIVCERNKSNGLKGGRPTTQNNPENPVGFLGTQNNPDEPRKPNSNTNTNSNSKENSNTKDNANKDNIGADAPTTKTRAKKIFIKPNIEEIKAYIEEKGLKGNGDRFFNYYESNGWRVGKNPMSSWKASLSNWRPDNDAQVMNGKPQGKQFLSAQDKARKAMYESTLTVIDGPVKTIEQEREEYFQKKILESITEPLQLGNKTN